MAEVTAAAEVALGPEAATALWRDPRRWSGFVEGFQRVEDQTPEWPAEGGKVVWVSGEGGRGRVTEKVKATRRRSSARWCSRSGSWARSRSWRPSTRTAAGWS